MGKPCRTRIEAPYPHSNRSSVLGAPRPPPPATDVPCWLPDEPRQEQDESRKGDQQPDQDEVDGDERRDAPKDVP